MTDIDVLTVASELGVSSDKLYMLSNNYKPRKKRRGTKYENYHTVVIHRGRGHKNRILSVPNNLLTVKQLMNAYMPNRLWSGIIFL